MMKRVLAFVALWIGLILDSTLFQIPPINVIQPDLVLIVLMVIAVLYGPRSALLYGVAIGLIQDVAYGQLLGPNAFTYGLIGYVAATLFQQFLHRSVALTFFLTICFTFVEKWMTYGLTRLFNVTGYRVDAVLRQSVQEMIVNGVLVLLLYPLLLKMLEQHSKRRYQQPDSENV